MVKKLSSSLSRGPLANFKVIEIGSFIAGPFCGQLLADLGAEVIKIEPPKSGDTMRTWGSSRTPNGDSQEKHDIRSSVKKRTRNP